MTLSPLQIQIRPDPEKYGVIERPSTNVRTRRVKGKSAESTFLFHEVNQSGKLVKSIAAQNFFHGRSFYDEFNPKDDTDFAYYESRLNDINIELASLPHDFSPQAQALKNEKKHMESIITEKNARLYDNTGTSINIFSDELDAGIRENFNPDFEENSITFGYYFGGTTLLERGEEDDGVKSSHRTPNIKYPNTGNNINPAFGNSNASQFGSSEDDMPSVSSKFDVYKVINRY